MFLRQITRQAPRLAKSLRTSTATAIATRNMSTAGAALTKLAAESPHVDVIRYHHKNQKMTLKHVDHHSASLAVGLLDCGLAPGDVVLSWLPSHFAEQHILQFACSKAGLILYTLDPSTSSNPKALAAALTATNANALITQEAGNDTNYIRMVEEVIPETRIFNIDDGMPFISPRFPHLRFPIHTGFDYADKPGMIPLSDMLCPTGDVDGLIGADKVMDGKTALLGELVVGSDGSVKTGKVLSNDEVVKSGVWPEFSSILNKDYREVEGVGVVW